MNGTQGHWHITRRTDTFFVSIKGEHHSQSIENTFTIIVIENFTNIWRFPSPGGI